jgi:hypothetical protein
MEAIRPFEMSVLIRAMLRNIPEDGFLPSNRRENLKGYIALAGCALLWRSNVSPVRYELGCDIPEDGILQRLIISSNSERSQINITHINLYKIVEYV